MKSIVVHNPNNLKTVDYHKLKVLQGDLKTLTEENKAKLCKSILEHGYFIPAFVWCFKNDMYILDATQRYYALESLEEQGYTIPKIPYITIDAKDKKDAAQKLLQITSRYGTINESTTFFEDFDIDLSFIENVEIPELVLQGAEFDNFSQMLHEEMRENDTEREQITFVFSIEDARIVKSAIETHTKDVITSKLVVMCTKG